MQKFKMTRLAAVLAVAVGLSACGADGSSSGGSSGSPGSSGGSGGSANILDETQTQASNTITGLAGALAGTPLGGFVQCLDPAVNQLLDGPDSLLTNLLKGLNAGLGTQDPAQLADALSAGGGDLAASLQSLTTTLPNALMALAGSTTCSQYGSTSGSSSGSGSSIGTGPTGTPLDQLIALIQGGGATGTPLDALISALPTGGSSGGGTTGPTGTPLDAVLGPLLALQNGGGDQAQIVDLLGIALTDLGTTIATQNPDVPVVGELVNLLATTVSDLGTVLNQLEQPTTAADLERTLNNLLTNVNNTLTAPNGLLGTLAANDPTGQFQAPLAGANTQINDAITTVTTQLGSALLQPVAGTGGVTPTLLSALQPLTCALQLTGACTGSSTPSLSTGGSSPLAPLTGALRALRWHR